MAQLMPQSG